MWISLAALLLAAMLFFLSLVPTEPPDLIEPPPKTPQVEVAQPNVTPPIAPAPAVAPLASGVIRSEKELIAALGGPPRTPDQKLTLTLDGPIVLKGGLSIGDAVKAPMDIELTSAKPLSAQFLFTPSAKPAKAENGPPHHGSPRLGQAEREISRHRLRRRPACVGRGDQTRTRSPAWSRRRRLIVSSTRCWFTQGPKARPGIEFIR